MSSRIVYVACADPPEIHIFTRDTDTGALTPVDVVGLTGMGPGKPGSSLPLALSPDQSRLYAAVRTPPYPGSSFAVDRATGALRLLGVAELPNQMCFINTDRTARHLLAASYQGLLIASHALDADGAIRSPATQVIDEPPGSHCIMPSPSNRFVFVPNLSSDRILRFDFDAQTGRLTPLEPVATQPGSGPRHLRFAPDGRFAYLILELIGVINAYAFDADSGVLRLLQSVDIKPEGAKIAGNVSAAELQFTPDGRFLYGSVRSTNTIMALRVDRDTGLLTPIGLMEADPVPRAFSIDPAGRFLYCAAQDSACVDIYAIDGTTGVLSRVGTQPVGGTPTWITFLS